MKKTSKILAIALVLVLIMSLTISALAVTPDQKVTTKVAVTLSERDYFAKTSDATYTAVKIADLYRVGADNNGAGVYQYLQVLDADLAADDGFLKVLDDNGFAYDQNTGAITYKNGNSITSEPYVNSNTSDASRLAAAIAHYVVGKSGLKTETLIGETATQLECGYWVIYESEKGSDSSLAATKPILVDIRPEKADTGIAITLKDSDVDLEKTMYGLLFGTVAIGDEIEYQITTCFPVYENDVTNFEPVFTISDKLDPGLEFTSPRATIVELGGGGVTPQRIDAEHYTLTKTNDEMTIVFDPDYVMDHQGEWVVITYYAFVNEDAVVNKAGGNKNTVEVTYSNNPEISSSVKTLTDSAPAFTYAFDLKKLDAANEQLLEGATFEMKNGNQVMYFKYDAASNTYTFDSKIKAPTDGYVSVITTTGTDITFRGLNIGTYTLTELTAPTGYSKLAEPITINVQAEDDGEYLTGSAVISVTNATVKTDAQGAAEANSAVSSNNGQSDVNVIVRNYKGISLPETGSVTSIIVMVVGLMIVLGGAAYLVMSRKKAQSK